jgi:Flp pilus assembly protein TadD
MLRFAPKMMAVFLCTALAGCASAMPDIASLTGGNSATAQAKKITAAATMDKTTPTDLDGSIRQAQLMRSAGQYDDAIRVLSQLMLVASDDPRVVSEYGKTLAEKGRAQDAVEFLNRAIELSSNDWTLYSALGVSYDQLGNQTAARTAYEHALSLRPNEPSVLNNYALSRMLANDPDGARLLIAKSQAAGGANDSKIAANITMLNKLFPAPPAPANVGMAVATKPASTPKLAQPAFTSNSTGLPGPSLSSQSAPAPRPAAPQVAQGAPRVIAPAPVAQNAPRSVAPVAQTAPRPVAPQPQQMAAAPVVPSGVVMQAVPFDPYAGLVKPRAPSPKAVAAKTPAPAKTADTKAAPANTNSKAGAKTASNDQVPALRLTADARSP